MLETLLGLALLPFAIATTISLIALVFIIVTKGWKLLIALVLGFITAIALILQSEWWVLFVLIALTLMAFLWGIGAWDDDEQTQSAKPLAKD